MERFMIWGSRESATSARRRTGRIAPVVVNYSVDATIPAEMQTEINRLADFQFSSADFDGMAEGLALCVATRRAGKNGPNKGLVLKRMEDIAETSLRLKRLLDPSLSKDKHQALAAAEVVRRLRPALPAYLDKIDSMLGEINEAAREHAKFVNPLRTLPSGSDGFHLDFLLGAIREVLDRNKLSTSYTTLRGKRRGLASDIAAEISKLLPNEIRLSPPQAIKSVFLNRLVAMRRQEKRREKEPWSYQGEPLLKPPLSDDPDIPLDDEYYERGRLAFIRDPNLGWDS